MKIVAFGAVLSPLMLMSTQARGSVANGQLLGDGFEQCTSAPTRVSIPRDGTDPIEGWLFASTCATASAPAVVMLHGCSGVYGSNGYGNAAQISGHFREWGAQLNREGMHALLADSFSTRDSTDPQHSRQNYCSDRSALELIGATEETDRPFDALAAFEFLQAWQGAGGTRVDPARVALMGWSQGGSATLATVAAGVLPAQPFNRAISFYPGCGLYGRFGSGVSSTYVASVPLDLFAGTADPVTKLDDCSAHATHSNQVSASAITIHPFPDAQHNFDSTICVADPNGTVVSPSTGLGYQCSGSHDGIPLGLASWRARVIATAFARCLLSETGACQADSFEP